ncbi:MAG: 2Fe-2S iron-sulfur cluster binding domain-containing protein [Flavobacteriales bacterium]|nr:2Fe-2S iron-sulfur cluster binding domain-containing protein [Flavobacteriales bacterium]
MSSDFYKLTIEEVVKETEDCVSLSFGIPDELKDKFSFYSGQYLTLKQEIDGADLRRSYSLCSEPSSGVHKVAIKQVEKGVFSTFANVSIKKGDSIECFPPTGNFKHIPSPKSEKNYVLFAAGSGITPILSILKSILLHEEKSTVNLFYGNKGFSSVIFREEIEALKNNFINRLSVTHIFSKENLGNRIQKGRIDEEKCEYLYDAFLKDIVIDDIYICGPEQMTLSIREVSIRRGVPSSNIHLELFGTSIKKVKSVVAKNTPSFDSVIELKLDGDEFEFPLNSEGENILDAAQKTGIDLPFACKGGVCCTCKAKVLEGNVSMDVNYGLEQDEIENGYVLTCQAHPTTEKVIISFDD